MAIKKTVTKANSLGSSKATYKDMITTAILTLKERNGTSRQGLKKFVVTHFKVKAPNFDALFNLALRKGVENGDFSQPKGASGPVKVTRKAISSGDSAKRGSKAGKSGKVTKPATKKAATAKKSTKAAAAKPAAAKKATSTKKSTKAVAKPAKSTKTSAKKVTKPATKSKVAKPNSKLKAGSTALKAVKPAAKKASTAAGKKPATKATKKTTKKTLKK